MTFGAILKNTTVATFWATLGKFGLLFTSISGHTGTGAQKNVRSLKNLLHRSQGSTGCCVIGQMPLIQ